METREIHNLLSSLLPSYSTNFLGVFPRDEVPNLQALSRHQYPLCFVVNLDPKRLPGSHWVAFFYPSPRLLLFFDSYGMSPHILGFPIPNYVKTIYNQYKIQSLNSSVCGHYCIYFLLHAAAGESIFSLCKELAKLASFQADNLVHSFINRIIALK